MIIICNYPGEDQEQRAIGVIVSGGASWTLDRRSDEYRQLVSNVPRLGTISVGMRHKYINNERITILPTHLNSSGVANVHSIGDCLPSDNPSVCLSSGIRKKTFLYFVFINFYFICVFALRLFVYVL